VPDNPFRFEGPLDPDDLIGRDVELDALVTAALERRIVSVAAPRRYGKTSLLRAAGRRVGEDYGFVVAHVDLLGLAGPEDFAARFGSAWRRATSGSRRLRRQVEQLAAGLVGLGVTVLGSGIQVTRRSPGDQTPLAVVHALLDLPGDADAPVLVVLDEFQALHAAWPDGEGVLRSHLQSPQQSGRVAWAFAGSQPTLLAAAFADAGRAFYRQALPVPLGRLPDADLAAEISERFAATDREAGPALAPLIRLAAGHPQRAMLLAHLLWTATPARGQAGHEAWEAALGRVRSIVTDEAAAVWESLRPPAQAALRAVHLYGSATAAAAAGPAASRSSRQAAQESLARSGVIEPDSRRGPRNGIRYRLVDPLLGDWIDQRSR